MILATDKLTKNYGAFRALDELTLAIRPGEIVGLLGPNGSGKSTALRIMLGFMRPSSGAASIAGHDCWQASHLARRHVAYLPGELRLYENMTGRQIVEFLGKLRPGVENRDYGELARRFDIDLSRPLAQLSSGMKRKVALLAVLTPHTPLVILDEPTNTLDPTMRDEFLAQLRETRHRGQAVLFSSHVLSEVEAVCDRVAILQRGRLVHEQAVAELRAVQRVRVTFAKEAGTIPDFKGLRGATRTGQHIDFEWSGPLGELLGWLGSQHVAEMKMDSVGLARIYHQYHGAANPPV
jgi:ABC-2 type transport system ATP-binding protein